MASFIITSIHSTLEDLALLQDKCPDSLLQCKFAFLRQRLRNLITFLRCSRKLSNDVHLKSDDSNIKDGSLGSLIARIEDAVCRNAQKIHTYRLSLEDGFCMDVGNEVDELQHNVDSFENEIDKWYILFSDCSRQQPSPPRKVVEIIDSVLDNLEEFLYMNMNEETLVQLSEPLGEKIKFLRNFISFATLLCAEHQQLEYLLAHIEAIAIDSAHLIAKYTLTVNHIFNMSPYEKWWEWMPNEIYELLQRMKPINPRVYETYVQALTSIKLSRKLHAPTLYSDDDPLTIMKDFIDFLLSDLWEMLHLDTSMVTSVKDQRQVLYEGLRSMRTILKEQPNMFNEKIMDLAGGLIFDAGVIIFSLHQKDIKIDHALCDVLEEMKVLRGEIKERAPEISTSFDSIREDIRNIKTDVLKIFHGKTKDFKIEKVIQRSSQVISQNITSKTDEVVGFHDEATSIIDRLVRGSKQLQIVAIVGMAGQGKTTLATKVYNDNHVLSHFHVRAWSTVSQIFNKKKVLLELLNHIVPDRSFEMDEHDLAAELRRRLKGRRYLIFLDDIWAVEAWNSLELSLPNDSNGSRIILTSRLHDVAPRAMLDAEPHFLRQLTNDESLELLERKLFPGTAWPSASQDLGMQIAETCKGLPLTILIIAGVLATMEQEDWEGVLGSLNSGIISSAEQCKNSLQLSYKHLPDYLKPCFLYFGIFHEDQEISVKRVIWLWISEGFVQKSELKSLEDVATNYMMDLIGRSLVMVAKHKSIGGVKTCRIHDLLHDFCLSKAKEENLFQLLQGYDELVSFNEPVNLQRLCIYSKQEHFKEAKIFCPRVHSLLFFDEPEWLFDQRTSSFGRASFDISFITLSFKLLRVLHVRQINIGEGFPRGMEFLVQLRYLAFQCKMEVIPPSIGNLSNLETFVMDPRGGKVSVPHTLWNLQKLRHLHVRLSFWFSGLSLPIENLDSSPNLYELDSFSGAIFPSWQDMENQMRKFPNIRKLKCKVFEYENDDIEDSRMVKVAEFLNKLESLDVSPFDLLRSHNHEFEFTFPANLKKLTLSYFGLPWSKISTIGNLPNLEVLKLLARSFSGETWEMEEGEFPSLRYLKLDDLDIVSWTASDDQFPNLQKLILKNCYRLKEIPSCLENIYTLEMIEVSSCYECIATAAQQVQDVQMDMGNSVLKILIGNVIAESSKD